jgi:hypothetical protein
MGRVLPGQQHDFLSEDRQVQGPADEQQDPTDVGDLTRTPLPRVALWPTARIPRTTLWDSNP